MRDINQTMMSALNIEQYQGTTVLVTGGSGYIGSHTVLELVQSGVNVVVVDNLSNSSVESLKRITKLTGITIPFYEADLLNESAIDQIFVKHPQIQAVIHFAGLKAVGESVSKPLHYYKNNITGTLNLLNVMQKRAVKNLVFSSSATVYGQPERLPIDEDCRLQATNPYGRTKLFIEHILDDLCVSDASWNCICLRYFNPSGAHPSGLLGEDPQGIPNNLMPYVVQTAAGIRPFVNVFGNDYDTPDGTGVRDYIHVVDLAKGHLAAVQKLLESPRYQTYNLGTGRGYSVLEMIEAMSKASGRQIQSKITARRPGDVASAYANPAKAENELNWKATRQLTDMCVDLWKWQSNNPNGFNSKDVPESLFTEGKKYINMPVKTKSNGSIKLSDKLSELEVGNSRQAQIEKSRVISP
ncbi:hypothetical protein MP228_012031 [Amoeboaphelidium protococcarum]|nr:hypothetical protein MP228_012031 [Amoeboaphelidium protococcarum]